MPASIEDAREDEREEVFMVGAMEVGGGVGEAAGIQVVTVLT
jgi:hypothetical protein